MFNGQKTVRLLRGVQGPLLAPRGTVWVVATSTQTLPSHILTLLGLDPNTGFHSSDCLICVVLRLKSASALFSDHAGTGVCLLCLVVAAIPQTSAP